MDVSYHVSQYQTIIEELKGEISRLNSKLQSSSTSDNASSKNKEKTEQLREKMKATFKEQMDLRSKLMEIDNNVLALSMEFEKQNQVVQAWEAERLRRSKKPSNGQEITIGEEGECKNKSFFLNFFFEGLYF